MPETKFLVVVTHPIPDEGLALLRRQFTVKVNPHDRILTPAELVKFVRGADALLVQLTDNIDDRVLAAAGRQLKLVANYAVGFDNIDLAAAKKRKVIVTNTPGVSSESVAEHALLLMLAVCKKLIAADKFVRAGRYRGWEPNLFSGSELYGKILGVLGLGGIGRRVAEIAAQGFKMKVIYYDVSRRNRALEQELRAQPGTLRKVLTASDFISLHVPLTPKTRHLIGRREFTSMKREAVLINTARGAVVDEQALIWALGQGIIAGAGIDVYEHEPKIPPALLRLPNVVLTPHTASSTIESRVAMSILAARNILAVLQGRQAISPVR